MSIAMLKRICLFQNVWMLELQRYKKSTRSQFWKKREVEGIMSICNGNVNNNSNLRVWGRERGIETEGRIESDLENDGINGYYATVMLDYRKYYHPVV